MCSPTSRRGRPRRAHTSEKRHPLRVPVAAAAHPAPGSPSRAATGRGALAGARPPRPSRDHAIEKGRAMTDIAVCQDLARPRRAGGESPHALARCWPGSGIPVPPDCREMIRRGALVAVNHSGGKDSQCMTILLSRIVPREQIVVVHAPLAEVEWPGTIEHIESTIPPGVPLIMAPVASGKTLLEQVEERGMWPSKSARWCTSGTKRGPIERELRRYLKAHPRFEGRLVNALGLRRDESRDRARRIPWRRNERMSVAGREVFDWLPVFKLTTEDVFRVIAEAGQSPHPVYSFGLTRCSCSYDQKIVMESNDEKTT